MGDKLVLVDGYLRFDALDVARVVSVGSSNSSLNAYLEIVKAYYIDFAHIWITIE